MSYDVGTVRSQAEQVVEHYGLPAEYPQVDRLVEDPLFVELSLAQYRATLAARTARREAVDGVDDEVEPVLVERAETDLRSALRERAAKVLDDADDVDVSEGSA